MNQDQLNVVISLGVALLGGLTVGIEREWSSRAPGEHKRFAGVRTFALIGLIGALGVELIQFGQAAAGIAALACGVTLIATSYFGFVSRGHRDSTTEFAAIIVLATGALAATGRLSLAAGLDVLTAFLLVEKGRIHGLVFRIESEELRAGLRFAVLALIILPLLPEGPFGPEPGIRPRALWIMVLLFSGVSFAGYIAQKSVGTQKGYRLVGALGGLISSTLVTLNFSRESRNHPGASTALAAGVIAACTILPIRVGFLTTLLNRSMGWAVLPYLAITLAVGIILLLIFRGNHSKDKDPKSPENPLRLLSAIQMAFAFQAALYVMRWVIAHFSFSGVMIAAVLAGLTDVDTMTFMIAKQTGLDPHFAAQALTAGILSNTILKMLIAIIIGQGKFRKITAISLGLIAVVIAAALLFLR